MGYAVLHMEKTSGTDAAMSAHIERTIRPKNADAGRTHLNRELIRFPDGIENRTQAIQHRLDTAGLTRKIDNNQVMAIRILLQERKETAQEELRRAKREIQTEKLKGAATTAAANIAESVGSFSAATKSGHWRGRTGICISVY